MNKKALSQFDNYEQILNEFLSYFVDFTDDGFALVYRNNAPTIEEIEEHIGDKVYCVYSLFEGDFGTQTTQPISLFSYGNRQKVFEKKEQISYVLQNGAIVFQGKDIRVKFTSGSPFVQDRTDPDDNVKGYYINILATVYKI